MTDHIGDVTQMVPMTQQEFEAIGARCEVAQKLIKDFGAPQVFQKAIDALPALLAEVERLRSERDGWQARAEKALDYVHELSEGLRSVFSDD